MTFKNIIEYDKLFYFPIFADGYNIITAFFICTPPLIKHYIVEIIVYMFLDFFFRYNSEYIESHIRSTSADKIKSNITDFINNKFLWFVFLVILCTCIIWVYIVEIKLPIWFNKLFEWYNINITKENINQKVIVAFWNWLCAFVSEFIIYMERDKRVIPEWIESEYQEWYHFRGGKKTMLYLTSWRWRIIVAIRYLSFELVDCATFIIEVISWHITVFPIIITKTTLYIIYVFPFIAYRYFKIGLFKWIINFRKNLLIILSKEWWWCNIKKSIEYSLDNSYDSVYEFIIVYIIPIWYKFKEFMLDWCPYVKSTFFTLIDLSWWHKVIKVSVEEIRSQDWEKEYTPYINDFNEMWVEFKTDLMDINSWIYDWLDFTSSFIPYFGRTRRIVLCILTWIFIAYCIYTWFELLYPQLPDPDPFLIDDGKFLDKYIFTFKIKWDYYFVSF